MCLKMLLIMVTVVGVATSGTIEGRVSLTDSAGVSVTRIPSGAVVFVQLDQPGPSSYVIDVRDKEFVPRVAIVPRDAAVVFRNSGSLSHNLYADSGANSFEGSRLDGGARETVRFSETGLVEVNCKVYREMRAFLLVRDRVVWSEVTADGSFRLSQLPPGGYRVQLWVPGFGYMTKTLRLSSGRQDLHFELKPTENLQVASQAPELKRATRVGGEDLPPELKSHVPKEETPTSDVAAASSKTPSPGAPDPAAASRAMPEKPAPTGSLVGQILSTGESSDDPVILYLSGEDLDVPKTLKQQRYEIVTKDKQFRPHVLAIPQGAQVHFPNSDPIIHNVFSVSGKNAFDAGRYAQDEGVTHRFDHAGLVKVFCNVHHEMNAYIMVVDSPHFAYAGPNGDFRFEALPPGLYTLNAWHPHGERKSVEVRIEAGRATETKLSFAFQARRVAHLNKFGKRYNRASSEAY